MSGPAKVSSIDALESFRADLIRYVGQARVALEDAEGGVRRARAWLDADCVNHWTAELKLRARQLEQAEADLYNARITRPTESHSFLKMAVARAGKRVADAEEKLLTIRHWRQQFDNRVTPLLRQLDPAFFLVGQHLPRAIHLLGESIKALQAYVESGGSGKLPEQPLEGGGG